MGRAAPAGLHLRLLPLPLPLDALLAVLGHRLAAVLHVAADGLGLHGEHAQDLERLDAVVDVELGVAPADRLLRRRRLGGHQLQEQLLARLLLSLVLGELVEQADDRSLRISEFSWDEYRNISLSLIVMFQF